MDDADQEPRLASAERSPEAKPARRIPGEAFRCLLQVLHQGIIHGIFQPPVKQLAVEPRPLLNPLGAARIAKTGFKLLLAV